MSITFSEVVPILSTIAYVRAEIGRMSAALTLAEQRIRKDPSVMICGCKETAALRRASMDLSRALVNLRKPW